MMRFLCIGDIHIGRSSSRIPSGVQVSRTAGDAWLRATEKAIELDADAVIVAGDVVDANYAYFAALGPLRAGMQRLSEAGIPVYAISGNHDFEVLRKMAGALEPWGFRLLGAKNVWEHEVVISRRGGSEQVQLWGWSFPGSTCEVSPLESFPDVGFGSASMPKLAVVHGTITPGPNSYAPLSLQRMQSAGIDLWLVGHEHKPADYRGEGASVINLGSLQALDPGETGLRGPWLVEVDASGIEARQIPVSTVAYFDDTLDVSGLRDEDELRAALEALFERCALPEGYEPLRVYRLTAAGRAPFPERIRQMCDRIVLDQPWQDRQIFIDDVAFGVLPDLDLEEIAGRLDAPGVLARMVLACQNGSLSSEYERLATAAGDARSELLRSVPSLDACALPDVQDMVREECLRLLDALMRGRQMRDG